MKSLELKRKLSKTVTVHFVCQRKCLLSCHEHIESCLPLSLVDRETIRQEVNNPEMAVLDHPSVYGGDLHQRRRPVRTSASSSLGRSLAVECLQSFLLVQRHIVLFWILI